MQMTKSNYNYQYHFYSENITKYCLQVCTRNLIICIVSKKKSGPIRDKIVSTIASLKIILQLRSLSEWESSFR